MGIQLPVVTAVIVTAPVLVGLTYDAQGIYVFAFYAIAGFCFATDLLLTFVNPPNAPVGRPHNETDSGD